MVDIGVAVLVAILTAILAYLGVHVTLHPATTPKQTRQYKIAFTLCGVAACVLIGVQAYRNDQSQKSLQSQLAQIIRNTKNPPTVQVTNNVPPPQVIFQATPLSTKENPTKPLKDIIGELTQKIQGSAPVGQPSVQLSRPGSTISPFLEVKGSLNAVEREAMNWNLGVADCVSQKDRALSHLKSSPLRLQLSDQENNNLAENAKVRYVVCIIKLDARTRQSVDTLIHDVINKAHMDAIARMTIPGSHALTANQEDQDKIEYGGAISVALREVSDDAEHLDLNRFGPLVKYLGTLQGQLGNYPENP